MVLGSFQLSATHIRAAEITMQQISGRTYDIILVVFTDEDNTQEPGGDQGVDVSTTVLEISGEEIPVGCVDQQDIIYPTTCSQQSVGLNSVRVEYHVEYTFPAVDRGYKSALARSK